MAISLHGISASKGVAIGRLHIVERGAMEVPERSLTTHQVEAEVARFRAALRRARAELKAVKRRIPLETPSDIAAFIDTHLLMLEDSALTKAPIEHIRRRHCNAEWALKVQRDAIVAVFEAMNDAYLRTRKDDVDHVVNRVQRMLSLGEERLTESPRSLTGRVVFADDLAPADTVLMQHQGVGAFVTEYGGPNSHTAILARSLGIPAVVGVHDARRYLNDEELVIVDGREGVLLVAPEASIQRYYQRRQRQIKRIRAARTRLRKTPTVTQDGEAVVLQANVELPGDLQTAIREGAVGVGLYRTEFLFMNRDQPPDELEQHAAYAAVINAAKGAPVTIRTLDLGADKQVDGSRPGAPISQNPALGLRAVRLCLKEQSLFRPQLRAILRASALGPVRLMVPMLSTILELAQVKELLQQCRTELEDEGVPFDRSMPVGGMIEVPAAAVCADIFARHLDFMSIGTNDLIQYTIAIDRVDDEVNYLYDPLHPAVLRLIHTTIKAGRRAGIPVAMCGEMAGDARYTQLLLGMGLKEFSVHPNALLEVKQAIVQTHAVESRRFANRILRMMKSSSRDALLAEMNRQLTLE